MKRDIEKLFQQRDKLNQKIKAYQEACTHEKVKVKPGSNTGNYDPYADCWWVDVHCQDCDSRMCYDSHEHPEQYRNYIKLHR